MNEIIVGLDIGTTKVCAIVGRKNAYGKLDILGIGKTEPEDAVRRGMIINIDRTVDAIKTVIKEASEKSGVEIKSVYVGIAGQHIKSLQHRGQITRPNAEDPINSDDIARLDEDMHKIVTEPGEKIIHVIPQDYIVDNVRGIKDPIGMAGVRLEGNFHVITGHISAVQNIYRCVRMAGLEVVDLVLEPIASSEAVLSREEKEAGVALIDIGGGTTDLAIFQDGIIRHTAVIPLGGEIVTNDIKIGCNIIYKQASALKIKFGCALADEAKENEIVTIKGLKGREPKEISVKNLAAIIEARMKEIFEHVYYEIKSSGFEKKLQGGIVLTGGGAQLKHLSQLVEYITVLDARIGYPTEHLASGLTQEVRSPMYSTCVGLILSGYNSLKSLPETFILPEEPLSVPEESAVETIDNDINKGFVGNIMDNIKKWLQDGHEDFK